MDKTEQLKAKQENRQLYRGRLFEECLDALEAIATTSKDESEVKRLKDLLERAGRN